MENNIINEIRTKITANNDRVTMRIDNSTIYVQIEAVLLISENSPKKLPVFHVLCFVRDHAIKNELKNFYKQLKVACKTFREDSSLLVCNLIKTTDNAKLLSLVFEKIFAQELGISEESKKEFLDKVHNLFNW